MLRHLPSCCAAVMLAAISLTLSAQPGNSPVPLPQTMRFCSFYCFTLIHKGDHYDAFRDDAMDGKPASTYRVRDFSRNSVALDRQDAGGNKAELTGKISAYGNSIEGGKITWVVGANGTVAPYQLTWGDAIGAAIPITVTHGYGGAFRPWRKSTAFCACERAALKMARLSFFERQQGPTVSQFAM
jgi:hypothetical protein